LMELPALRWLAVGVNPSTRAISDAYYSRFLGALRLKLPYEQQHPLTVTVTETTGMWWTGGAGLAALG